MPQLNLNFQDACGTLARSHSLRFYGIRVDSRRHIRPRLSRAWQGRRRVGCRVWIRITGRKRRVRIESGHHAAIVAWSPAP
jgi:hypothetical protein